MHFHYCGNPAHDIIHNTFVLLVMMPDWLPGIMAARDGLKHKLMKSHTTEDTCPRGVPTPCATGRMCTSHPNTSNPPRNAAGLTAQEELSVFKEAEEGTG